MYGRDDSVQSVGFPPMSPYCWRVAAGCTPDLPERFESPSVANRLKLEYFDLLSNNYI